MRLATFEYEGWQYVGAVREDTVVPLEPVARDMLTLIEAGERTLGEAKRLVEKSDTRHSLASIRLLAPIPRPHKNIFALGRNYAEHARESAAATGQKVGPPVIFTKAPTTVNSPHGDLVVDPSISVQVDWEVELAVIIGKRIRKATRDQALDSIFGYTVLNDVSARDLQNQTSQFFIGKSVDGYCPMGPWIVTKDEIPDPQNLTLRCKLNDVVKQQGNTSDMIYDLATIIQHLTTVLTLEPGDIVTTGTPAGVGFARKPPEFLKPGDILESEIEGIGVLRNRVVGV